MPLVVSVSLSWIPVVGKIQIQALTSCVRYEVPTATKNKHLGSGILGKFAATTAVS